MKKITKKLINNSNNNKCFNKLLIIIPIIILIFGVAIAVYFYFKNKTVKYFKCPEKPNADLLNGVLAKNKIILDDKEYNFFMPCGYNFVEDELDEMKVPKSKYIFALRGCDNIVSKNNLWEILEKKFGRNGASKIMPESFIIEDPDEYEEAKRRVRNGTVLICKKNLQRKLGLKLAFDEKDLKDALDDDFKVAQVFLTEARQIKDRKINLRVYYVAIKKGKRIDFYVNRNGKILYTKDKTTGEIKFESHITSYQMDPDLYEKENLPHNFKELRKYLGPQEYSRIWVKLMAKLKIFSGAIGHVFEDDKFKDKVCFQLFGMDVILDGDEPYILEVNKGPDMIPKCNKDNELKQNIYEEVFNLAGLIHRPFKQNNFMKIYTYIYN